MAAQPFRAGEIEQAAGAIAGTYVVIKGECEALMNTDLNGKIQGKLKQNRKKRNMKKALLVLSLAAVIFTSTVLANPASALTEDVSGEVVQGLENNSDAQTANEQTDAQENEAASSDDQQEAAAAPAAEQDVMNTDSVSAADSAAVTENGTEDSGAAASGAEVGVVAKSADEVSGAEGSGTAENAVSGTSASETAGTNATLAEAAETVSTEEAAAEKTEEKKEQTVQTGTDALSFEDDRAQMKITRRDGSVFPSDTTMSGSPLGTDDWNKVLSAVSSKVTAQSDDSITYSVAGLHTWTLSLQAGDGSAASYDDIRTEAQFQGGLNDAGYATKTSEKEKTGTDGTSTTTVNYETSWRVYAISGDSIANPVEDHLTDLTDKDGTSLSVDENGALQSAAFDGSFPETVLFVQVVKETLTSETEKKEEIPMPAVTFDKEVATDHGTIAVHVEADEGTFEQGTTMSVKQVSSQDILDKAIEAAGGKGDAEAVDISFLKADGTETEPAKPIRVRMTAKILDQADKAHVVHVDDTGSTDVVAKKSDGKTIDSTSSDATSSDAKNAVSFESDSFSVYAIVYTVDFTFRGYTYSIKGGSSIRLSSLAQKLGLRDTKQDKDFDIADVDDVTFSDKSLVTVTKEDGDWELVSNKPFTSTEKLTISMKDGSKYEVEVKDAQEDQVNQGTTCKVYFLDGEGNPTSAASTKSGEELNARVRLTNSSANTGEYSYVKVAIEGLGQYVTLKNNINTATWDTITIEDSNTHQSIEIGVYFDKTSNSIIYRIPAGATAIVPLDFKTNNGITPNGTEVTLTPGKCDENGNAVTPSDNDKIGEAATGKWNSTFKWDPISKKVNGQDNNTISIDDSVPGKPVLTGDLLYTYSANSGNRSTSGMRWTNYAEVSDTVTLPEGVTLPENYSIDKNSGEIKDSSNKTIWKLNLKSYMTVKDILVSGDRHSIIYGLRINNENKNGQGTLTGELENLSWSGVLSTDQLVLDSGYTEKVIKGNGNAISNRVQISEHPIVGDENPSSEDTVTTTPKYTSYQIEKTSSKESQTLKPGDPVDYAITVSNKSSAAITGDDSVIVDPLPKALTLDQDEITRLNNIEGVTVTSNYDGTYSIRYKTDIPANGSIKLKINAKVKDVKALKKDNVSTDISNTASYKDVSDTVISYVNYGHLSVEKTGDNKDQWGNVEATKNGKTVHFTVTVKNDTDYPADKDYTLTDTLPAYLQLKLYSDEQCQNQVPMDELYTGQKLEKTDVYVKDLAGKGHKVNVTIDPDGTATITKNYQYSDGFPAHTTEPLGYEVVFNASKASGANTDSEGNVSFQNVAKLDDGTQGESGFKGQTGKVTLSKDVTGAVRDGNKADEPYEDQTIVSYKIHVANDETNPKTGNFFVYDDLPCGLMPYGLKKADDTEVNNFDDLVSLAGSQTVLKDENGRDVTITYAADHFRLSWTISNPDGKFESADIGYRAQIQQSKIPDLNGETVTLTNKASSGNTSVSKDIHVKGNGISIEKWVRNDATGEWVKSIKVKPNTSYTYKLIINNPNHVTAVIKNIQDVLPYADKALVLNRGYWEKDKTVTADLEGDFVKRAVDKYYPYPYTINGGVILFSNVQIYSSDDKLTQTVTLKWPDSDALSDWYARTSTDPGYSSSKNRFIADGMEEHVYHQPVTEKKYYLQKSVIALNYGNGSTTYGKEYFSKDKLKFVEYGIVFANTGNDPLHLNQLTDVLPDDLNFYGVTASDVSNNGKYPVNTTEINSLAPHNEYYAGTNFILPKGYSVPQANKVSTSVTGQVVTLTINDGKGVDLASKQVIAFNIWCKVKDDAASTMKENEPITNAIRAEVDKDAELSPVLITTTKTPYDDLQNNGSCSEIATGDITKTAESTVTIYPINMPIPGIQKTAARYRELSDSTGNKWSDWADLSADHSQNISSQCQIEWKIRLYNDGTVPISDYTFRDKLSNKHNFVSATWKLGSSSGESKPISLEVSSSTEENRGLNVAVWKAQGDEYKIPAGEFAEITVITKYASAGFQGQLTNDAYFEPAQECDYNGVQRGQLEKNADGTKYIGVSSGDYVNMYGDGATISYKQVTEADDSSNTAYGYNISTGKNFITISDKADTFRYTASVTNVSKSSLYAYTMMDTLPAPNDTGVVNANDQRGSKFTVKLSDNPDFVITLEGKDKNGKAKKISLDADDYQLNYSDKTTFTGDDWAGKESDDWKIAKPDAAKAFRIVLKPDKVGKKLADAARTTNNVVLPSSWTLKVSFTCTAGTDAAPGDIAWNSFGYRYAYLNDLDDPNSYLTAEPPKVGVKIPAEPVIKKVVEDANGNNLGEDKNVKFTFMIYKGEVTPKTTQDELTKALIETAVITKGGYHELKPKVTVNGVEQGFYEEGLKYTVIEDDATGYKTSRFEVNGAKQAKNQNYCTFTYHRNSSLSIECVNREEQSFALPSTGGPGDLPWVAPGMLLMLLAGAVFAVRKLLILRNAGKGGGSK